LYIAIQYNVCTRFLFTRSNSTLQNYEMKGNFLLYNPDPLPQFHWEARWLWTVRLRKKTFKITRDPL